MFISGYYYFLKQADIFIISLRQANIPLSPHILSNRHNNSYNLQQDQIFMYIVKTLISRQGTTYKCTSKCNYIFVKKHVILPEEPPSIIIHSIHQIYRLPKTSLCITPKNKTLYKQVIDPQSDLL